MPRPAYNVNDFPDRQFDEFGNDLSEHCPTLDESRAARQEREAEWIAEFRKQRLAREQLADNTLVQIAPVADDGLGAEFESEPFRNATMRDAEWEAQSREWERDRLREEDRAA